MQEIDRRTFCTMLGGSLAAASACRGPQETTTEALTRLLGLAPEEVVWLGALSEKQQQQLRGALDRRGTPSSQTVDLVMMVVGRRERLFPYVGYPPMPNRLSACDGLLRE